MPVKQEKTKKATKTTSAKKAVSTKAPAAKKTAVKVAAKKTVAKKNAPAKAIVPTEDSSSKLTRIIVKYNVGWGNQLFIRGTGAGLNWHKGVLMQCVGEDEWLWEQLVSQGGLKFKVLVNDEIWNLDEDSAVDAGDTVIFHPSF